MRTSTARDSASPLVRAAAAQGLLSAPTPDRLREADRPELILNAFGIVVGAPKKALATAVATAQAGAVDWRASELFLGAPKEFIHVFMAAAAERR